MNSYLFILTVGPVQSFIVQARKTRDLYNGSKLLSDLINEAIGGLEPIFPQKGLDSYPNRFIAIIERENDDEIKKFGDELKERIIEFAEKLALKAIDAQKINPEKLPKSFYQQIKDHLQIHWVAIPYDSNNYKQQFSEIESSLGAIKNIRMFEQLEETGRKCSLCGERNLIFSERGKKNKFQIKPNWDLLNESDKNIVKEFNDSIMEIHEPFDSSEGLCAVCFTKRFYQENSFPSTAEIAVKDTISRLDNSLIKDYKKLFNDFDAQLFYEENLTSKYFEKQFIKGELKNIKEYHKNIKEVLKNQKLKISPYYAVVMFDGDSMGKWLSGHYLKDGSSLLDFHKTLSSALGQFAKQTANIVREPKGKVVFAGGEDFLAFINLNHLFHILKELRNKFDDLVNKAIDPFKKSDDSNLTFSAGIVIAHYKTPLTEVLNWARKMEKEAKGDNKNAFSIAVLKHSGEINKTSYTWGDTMQMTKNLDTISELTSLIAEDKFSNTFINNITAEMLSTNDHKGISIRNEMLKSELMRLMKRACKIKLEKELISNIVDKVGSLYSDSKTENFYSALHIAEFISRHLNGGNKNEN